MSTQGTTRQMNRFVMEGTLLSSLPRASASIKHIGGGKDSGNSDAMLIYWMIA